MMMNMAEKLVHLWLDDFQVDRIDQNGKKFEKLGIMIFLEPYSREIRGFKLFSCHAFEDALEVLKKQRKINE
jgi:hypothetical protein